LRFRDEEVAEHLHARDIFKLFRINEIALKSRRFHIVEHLNKARFLVDEIIGQDRNTGTARRRVIKAGDVIDRERGGARVARIAPNRRQPMHVEEMRGRGAAECQNAMFFESRRFLSARRAS